MQACLCWPMLGTLNLVCMGGSEGGPLACLCGAVMIPYMITSSHPLTSQHQHHAHIKHHTITHHIIAPFNASLHMVHLRTSTYHTPYARLHLFAANLYKFQPASSTSFSKTFHLRFIQYILPLLLRCFWATPLSNIL